MGRRLAAVLAAASLIASPAIAQSGVASKLSVANSVPASARSGADLENANELRGGFLVPAVAVIAIILGILVLTSGGEEGPHSP